MCACLQLHTDWFIVIYLVCRFVTWFIHLNNNVTFVISDSNKDDDTVSIKSVSSSSSSSSSSNSPEVIDIDLNKSEPLYAEIEEPVNSDIQTPDYAEIRKPSSIDTTVEKIPPEVPPKEYQTDNTTVVEQEESELPKENTEIPQTNSEEQQAISGEVATDTVESDDESSRFIKRTVVTSTVVKVSDSEAEATIVSSKEEHNFQQSGDNEPTETHSSEVKVENVDLNQEPRDSLNVDDLRIDSTIDFDPEQQQSAIKEKLDNLIAEKGSDGLSDILTTKSVTKSHEVSEGTSKTTIVTSKRVVVKTTIEGNIEHDIIGEQPSVIGKFTNCCCYSGMYVT